MISVVEAQKGYTTSTYLKLGCSPLRRVLWLDEVHLFTDLVQILLDALNSGRVLSTMILALLLLILLNVLFDSTFFPSRWTFWRLSRPDDRCNWLFVAFTHDKERVCSRGAVEGGPRIRMQIIGIWIGALLTNALSSAFVPTCQLPQNYRYPRSYLRMDSTARVK